MLKCLGIPFSHHTKALIMQPVSFHSKTVMVPNVEKKKKKTNGAKKKKNKQIEREELRKEKEIKKEKRNKK
jgi:hypothetical protein